ncbi:gamma-glutamylcyclotransferase [Algirhabdus cladophorae]|uniref:gamma-glutamylcyclotransferase n=1 Tax=Algirhabdus cladophorae TaxID=3377108 RepID=UPI003B847DF0
MQEPRFFGFGSLVNTRTHSYPDPQNSKIDGWARVWRKTVLRDIAFLSVEPSPASQLWGLSARVPDGNWADLDLRETGYKRLQITANTAIYIVDETILDPKPRGKILLSYLDVVIQGYLDRFGPEGPAHFFETTQGWDHEIIDDRSKPIYPRAQTIDPTLQNSVDAFVLAAQM